MGKLNLKESQNSYRKTNKILTTDYSWLLCRYAYVNLCLICGGKKVMKHQQIIVENKQYLYTEKMFSFIHFFHMIFSHYLHLHFA